MYGYIPSPYWVPKPIFTASLHQEPATCGEKKIFQELVDKVIISIS